MHGSFNSIEGYRIFADAHVIGIVADVFRAVHVADEVHDHHDIVETEGVAHILVVLELLCHLLNEMHAVLYITAIVIDAPERLACLVCLGCMRICSDTVPADRIESQIYKKGTLIFIGV